MGPSRTLMCVGTGRDGAVLGMVKEAVVVETPASDKRIQLEEVRDEDLEPYVTLRYIARLFKILAILMVVMLIGEVVTGLATEGGRALMTLIGEATKLLVIGGLMWGGGD